jgi:hypothetical protein
MGCFSQSKFQILRDVSAKVHNLDDDARSVLVSRIVMNHKVNLLQESSEQVHIASKELTAMVRNGKFLCSRIICYPELTIGASA